MNRMEEIKHRVKNWDQVIEDKEHASEFSRHSASDIWWLIHKVSLFSDMLRIFCKSTENYFGDPPDYKRVPLVVSRAIKHYRESLDNLEKEE